ncbi:MAG: phage tail protein [Planctomycetota bacterium]|nr:MAG: phage tail protein [Planctomycetota bacterium]
MSQFTVNLHRLDPYKNFKFRVIWEGRVVAGVSRVSALTRSTEAISHRAGADTSQPRVSPGSTSFEPVVLERGVTHDTDFEEWANLAFSVDGDGAMSLKDYRRDVIIELLNLQGVVVKRYMLRRCWVLSYQALPELDANGNAIAIERLVLQHEGFERDQAVTEPEES